MNDLATFMNALASLLWPAILAVALYHFREQVRDMLKRLAQIKKGRLLGQEIELDDQLNQLKVVTEQAQHEAEIINKAADISKPEFKTVEDLEVELLRDATRSPKLTLMLLSAEIEKRLRELLMQTGWHGKISATLTLETLSQLANQGSIPKSVIGSFDLFRSVRNKIVHGGAATKDSVLSAIDSGFHLLKAIDAIPHETNFVHQINVPLYRDKDATMPIEDVKGVVLETVSPGGSKKSFRIFPTTKEHFEVGKRVSWEWNLGRTWNDAWYRDPETGEIKQAWVSSGEFVGAHIDDL